MTTQAELDAVDARFKDVRLEPYEAANYLMRRNQELERANIALESQIHALEQKCMAGEASLHELQPLIEAYKSQFLPSFKVP